MRRYLVKSQNGENRQKYLFNARDRISRSVKTLLVRITSRLSSEHLAAELAREWLLTSVDSLVAGERGVVAKRPLTDGADERLLTSVHSLVVLQFLLGTKSLATVHAGEGLVNVRALLHRQLTLLPPLELF